MGWRFELKNANIVAYLTSAIGQFPHVEFEQLARFLDGIEAAAGREEKNVFISSDNSWIFRIAEESAKAGKELNRIWSSPQRDIKIEEKFSLGVENMFPRVREFAADEAEYPSYEAESSGMAFNTIGNNLLYQALQSERMVLQPHELESVLLGLRYLFRDYDFFALAVGASFSELAEFARHIAIDSGGKALILIPEDLKDESLREVTFLDPFPALSLLAEQEDRFPGMLFWSKDGTACFASLRDDEAKTLYSRLMRSADLREINFILEDSRSPRPTKKIIHISDLHFGQEITRNRRLLTAEIKKKKYEINQIVVTGDLIDRPEEEYLQQFEAFRDELEEILGYKEIVIVPGNHDVRILGNAVFSVGQRFQQLLNMRFDPVSPCDEIECVFFCFNSALSGNWARGEITNDQLLAVSMEFERQCRFKPELRNYQRIALVHHHLFPFHEEKTGIFQNALYKLKTLIGQAFVRMEGAEEFVVWCAENKIPLVLHGHEHALWTDHEVVPTADGNYTVRTVACGASFGVHGNMPTYNLLTWNDAAQQWKETPFGLKDNAVEFTQLNARVNIRQ